MGLKQSIVVVSEYTVKGAGGKGSRGSSPGAYVAEYMGRALATEDLTPVQYDIEHFTERYMARSSAVDTAVSVEGLKSDMRRLQGLGGVAFGDGDISLSHQKFRRLSRRLQSDFDSGKTVMKTVLSFDEEYLRENGIIDQGFTCEKQGDYRGNLDQLKLRLAIMNGLEKMSRHYDDLSYVGVIQVDTMHVHCHLAMVDRGRGTLARDGTQKGKISQSAMRDLRRGIDMFLDEKQSMRMMTSNITQDKRNALCYIKQFTHEKMYEQGAPQFLIACLPKNKNWWRAGTNREEMRKANQLVREMVLEVFEDPASGYTEAIRHIEAYAAMRMRNEDLTGLEYRQLFETGREKLIEDCMNGVYAVLKRIPDEELEVQTPLMDAMSLDYDDMAAKAKDDPMVEFGFKLRSYSTRLQHHKAETAKYHEAVKVYEQQQATASPASVALYEFFKEEEEYNAMLMAKYQHFLGFLPADDEYEDEYSELLERRRRHRRLVSLYNDPSPRRMSADRAEDYGLRVHQTRGGRYLTFNPSIIEARVNQSELDLQRRTEDFELRLSLYGLIMDENGIKRGVRYPFDDVKALDIHHLSYDFPNDFMISKPNVDKFIERTDKRVELFEAARTYLEQSGQGDQVGALPVQDVEVMKQVADRLRISPELSSSRRRFGGRGHDSHTIRLDVDYTQDMKAAIKSSLDRSSREFGDI